MEQILNNIVTLRDTPRESVDAQLLERYTKRIEGTIIKKIRWGKLEHLYILGNHAAGVMPLEFAAYEDTYQRWVLIIGAEDHQITKFLAKCPVSLEKLVIRFTGLEQMNLQRLTGLKNLMLEHNLSLQQLKGLGQMKELKKLHLTHTAIQSLELPEPMTEVNVLYADRTALEEAEFLQMLPGLRVLNLGKTPLTRLPSLEQLSMLKVLTLNNTLLPHLEGVSIPASLSSLDLSGTNIQRLPETIRGLKKLRSLNLSHMKLEELPKWLPDLELAFSLEARGSGIRLYGTQVQGVNMSIFEQPREMVVQWFQGLEENDYVFNTVKVALVGNKRVGKTTLLQWLIHGDESDYRARSGIITKMFTINGQRRRVQFWDVGEPEIQLRLHDRFLGNRALYLIVLDAGEGNLRTTAEYWLRQISDYAPDAPVLLAVNKIDQVSDFDDLVNLHSTYGNIRQILPIPNLMTEPEMFHSYVRRPLLEEILGFPELIMGAPKAWGEMARKREQHKWAFMKLSHYRTLCEQCGIGEETVQLELLKYYSDMGICYYLDTTQRLRDFILCDPSCFVGVVTELIQPHSRKRGNGVVQVEMLLVEMILNKNYTLLKQEEVYYILDLMRRCGITISIDGRQELIPLLCSRKTAKVFYFHKRDLQAKGKRINFERLSVTLIHRLMALLSGDLDTEQVWYYGAHFVEMETGQSVVLRQEGNSIQIYSRSIGEHTYLDKIVDRILELAGTNVTKKKTTEESLQQELGFLEEPSDPMLNEIRVLLLGDGEAGKSHIIRRLLKLRLEEAAVPESTGDATPGVEIHHGTYELIGGRKVRLNFWDFGGQEILHSMHRIFITDQTMCVVVLNARSGTQDDRAQYWLRFIQSVSPKMPVLLVLNKMDQNLNASLNEYELTRLYPSLTPAVCISAAKDDDQTLRDGLLKQLLRQIGAMDALQTKMPANWWRVKNELQNSRESYIREDAYRELCLRHNISDEGNMHRQLLDWFNIMGVGYRCDSPERIGTYMILRPEWVTNAVYAILFNRHSDVKNGIVSRGSLNDLLRDTKNIQCVDHSTGYNSDEVDYVIQMMRRYSLSYYITTEQQEFIPMLCHRNASSEVGRYADDPGTAEFWIRFEYLPDALLFHMMVEHYQELDRDNVWLTGARFVEPGTGSSAIIKREGQTLKLYVRAERFYPPATEYRDTLRRRIREIIRDHLPQLKILEECVVYKHHGGTEVFDFERLSRWQSKGTEYCYSKLCEEPIVVQSILNQTNQVDQERKEQLLEELMSACKKMQEVSQHREEDRRNKQLMHILSGRPVQGKKLIVLDQSQGGRGKTGIKMGERDLMISTEPDTPWGILEALNISGAKDKGTWKSHLDKLLDHYNPYGLRTLILLSYINCEQKGFATVVKGYRELLQTYDPNEWKLIPGTALPVKMKNPTNFLKVFRCCYSCGAEEESQIEVYHLFVRLDTLNTEKESKK